MKFMTSDRTSLHSHLPAPCIVDAGIVVSKQDMRRLLCDLGAVRYRYTQGDRCLSEGEGYVVEVFADPAESTLVVNHSLYLNVCSFDYLELSQVPVEAIHAETKERIKCKTCSTSGADKNKSNSNLIESSVAPQKTSPVEAQFHLVQENTRLQLMPLSNPLKARRDGQMNSVALEAVVADMLSANFDISDEEENFPF
ncbi:MAG: hypothetical protein F6K09_20245 [Merismopedia sp. SIO2A8]|nr:hypothetical protein [Symploca sp. SIO2B6]NET50969.1 hypothetical protein [Merismopedia sp. SIO2A8]